MSDTNREYVEAVPGPAIIISKEEAKRIKESKPNPEERAARWARIEKFVESIKDKTQTQENEDSIQL